MLAGILLAIFCASTALAQGAAGVQSGGGAIEARSLGDRVLIRVLLQTEAFQKETHVVVDYAAPAALELHRAVWQSLAYGDGERTLKLAAESFRLEVPRDAITEASPTSAGFLTEFTARYANELDNVDVSAIVGWPVLRPFALGLDLGERQLSLRTVGELGIQEAERWGAAIVRGLRMEAGVVHVPISFAASEQATLSFGLAGYHTYLNQDLEGVGTEPDDSAVGISFGVPPVLGLSGMVALFPQPFDQAASTPGGAPWLLRSGLGLWSAYRLEINPEAGYLALAQRADSNYSEADAAFYAAAAAEDVAALRTYAERWPDDRNVEEAARRMFDLGIVQGRSVAEQMEAVAIGLTRIAERRRTHYLLGFALPLYNAETRDEHSDLIVALGEQALATIARSDRPGLRQHAQLMLGDRYLHAGDALAAWKTFLAASFYGDPRLDGLVRHELGRAYEALGRVRRAYASYRRAAAERTPAPPDIKESARAGLDRLRPQLEADDPLLAEEAASG